VLGVVVLEEVLQQFHTFFRLDFVDFQQILKNRKRKEIREICQTTFQGFLSNDNNNKLKAEVCFEGD
jgi:hypothetical protein